MTAAEALRRLAERRRPESRPAFGYLDTWLYEHFGLAAEATAMRIGRYLARTADEIPLPT